MLIDIIVEVTPLSSGDALAQEKITSFGHLGTHFDAVDKTFPLDVVHRGVQHTPKDRYCAERSTFIVENLCNLASVLDGRDNRFFTAHTYPVKFTGMSGLPCRVVAEV